MALKLPQHVPVIDLWNKADAVAVIDELPGLRLSAKTGAGLDPLRLKLLEIAGWQPSAEGLFIARARHVQALQQANGYLVEAQGWLNAQGQSLDLLAEALRLAQHALGGITGEFTSDDLLGVIFSRFCIGK
jgi:tRNA modification GTPase